MHSVLFGRHVEVLDFSGDRVDTFGDDARPRGQVRTGLVGRHGVRAAGRSTGARIGLVYGGMSPIAHRSASAGEQQLLVPGVRSPADELGMDSTIQTVVHAVRAGLI